MQKKEKKPVAKKATQKKDKLLVLKVDAECSSIEFRGPKDEFYSMYFQPAIGRLVKLGKEGNIDDLMSELHTFMEEAERAKKIILGSVVTKMLGGVLSKIEEAIGKKTEKPAEKKKPAKKKK